ncbi:protein-glutamine gamma-glutamyltransferase 4-like [Mercenaria mercenaria]|uniref:protein-glutamine gamma-glutamyltransferase 4-like n=1 Tax=Mercenaria mercenaria TaxID=6596 RepID=UPI00234EB8E4|nr:protein-glutamine gamma-glutamyltransferase 4-like [Mercenaria mercenaria]
MGRRGRSSGDGVAANPPKRTRHRYNLRATSSRAKRDKLLGGEQDGRRTVISDEEFREKSVALAEVKEGSALTVESVDVLKKKNQEAHHTNDFELDYLVVRRGQAFSFQMKFDRNVNKNQDLIVVKFAYGARPQESKGTLIRLRVDLTDGVESIEGWVVKVEDLKDDTLTLSVTSAVDSMIGKYELLYETKLKGSEKDFTKQDLDTNFCVLFNPWCKADVVYMEDEAGRNEYVLNETGRIWIGSARLNYGKPWNFGQFESPVLEVALGLLDKGELADTGRSSVISVIRCLSALTNSMDDEGLLEGRWTSEYPKGCTKPWEWTGSVAIIEQFYETGKPVLYGQCWVFSAVFTTLLRCLGVPTRSVTTFDSAHDTDCSMTIDKHFDEDGEPLEDLDDSVWNFHVWNESYFRRLDLPSGYDGWQAHDATPQEASEGVMRCGPAPLKAIKEGHVYLNFDTAFIFSEVNGDRIQWTVNEDGSMEVFDIDKYSVGHNISTKAVGSDLRHDLTLDYKYRDGSAEERRVVEFVNRFSTERKKNIYKKEQKKELEYDLILPEAEIGSDLSVGVKVKNISSEDRNVRVRLTIASTFYTGVVGKKVKGELFEVAIEAGAEKDVLMSVSAEEYIELMNAEAIFKLTAACKVVETKHMFATSEPFTLKKPGLTFDVPQKICSSVETTAKLKYKNMTGLKLHNCVFHVEGSYIIKAKTIPYRKVVHPDDEISVDIVMFPRRLGQRTFMATFSSDELADVEGEGSVYVVSKSDWEEAMDETDGAGGDADQGGATDSDAQDKPTEAGE